MKELPRLPYWRDVTVDQLLKLGWHVEVQVHRKKGKTRKSKFGLLYRAVISQDDFQAVGYGGGPEGKYALENAVILMQAELDES